MTKRIAYRTCPLCEATCGLELHLDDDEITLVRGDRDDVFSRGYLCPKGTALKQLEADPDRLRRPQVRTGDTWREVSWDEAFAEIERGLGPDHRGEPTDAVGVYLGNPNAHNLGAWSRARSCCRRSGAPTCSARAPSTRCPSRSARASCSAAR